jgi:hypothetical protein
VAPFCCEVAGPRPPELFPRLIPAKCNVTSGTPRQVTDVTFRLTAFLVMIRLGLGAEIEQNPERQWIGGESAD